MAMTCLWDMTYGVNRDTFTPVDCGRATNQVHRPKVKREKIQVPKCIRLIDKTRGLTLLLRRVEVHGPGHQCPRNIPQIAQTMHCICMIGRLARFACSICTHSTQNTWKTYPRIFAKEERGPIFSRRSQLDHQRSNGHKNLCTGQHIHGGQLRTVFTAVTHWLLY